MAPGPLTASAYVTSTMTSVGSRPTSAATSVAQCVAQSLEVTCPGGVVSGGGAVTWIQGMGDPSVMTDAADGAQVRSAVVVGASGILAPLGAALHRVGVATWGVARGERPVGEGYDEFVPLDAQDPQAVRDWMKSLSEDPDLVVAYAPAVGDEVWALWNGWAGRLVVVATSTWAAPDAPAAPWPTGDRVSVLQLGWRDTGDSWHDPDVVSAAVVAVMTGGFPAYSVLGVIRPWEDRPR